MQPGELVPAARARHGPTEEQLAARARTSQAAISRIERELVSPTVETLTTSAISMGEELLLESREADSGFDRPHEQTLALRPAARIERQAAWARKVREIQRAAR